MKFAFSYLSFLSVFLLTLLSCSQKLTTTYSKTYPFIDYRQEVAVIRIDQPVPKNAEMIGRITTKVGNFSKKCSYTDFLDTMKLEARKVGGNAIKIIQHKNPAIKTRSCQSLITDILRVDSLGLAALKSEKEPFNPDADYAILNIYRYNGSGSSVRYDLRLGTTVLAHIGNNFKKTIELKEEGSFKLSAAFGNITTIPIELKHGKTYYLRCGVSKVKPTLELVDWKIGMEEFTTFKPE